MNSVRLLGGLAVALGAALAQTAGVQMQPLPGLVEMGGPMALAAWVFYCWRQDKREDAKRYEQLAQDYRSLISENSSAIAKNTSAITVLEDTLRLVPCIMNKEFRESVSESIR